MSLMLVLVMVIGAIATLFGLSKTSGLYETAFVYQSQVEIRGTGLGAFSPAALVTTAVGVAIALWWGGLDSTARRMQPFLSSNIRPQQAKQTFGLSYQTSYMAWAAFRASRNRHFLLASISLGAFLTQIRE